MSGNEDAIARVLIDEFEAGPAHAAAVAREIEKLFGVREEPKPAAPEPGVCGACGQPVAEWAGIAVDAARGELRHAGRRIGSLTAREFALVKLLFDARGRTLSKAEIMNGLYRSGARVVSDDEVPEEKIVDVYVCKVNKKLESLFGDEKMLVNVWGRGYYLRNPKDEP